MSALSECTSSKTYPYIFICTHSNFVLPHFASGGILKNTPSCRVVDHTAYI
ncbi:hypothetical protein WN51_11986 [Melipona quadrifasciata]|uniref:Uncharacterized protein n=1 Tax=Melipona quadrifasciata TaxID=166423 RepID=A0A0M9A4G1_9HYME|nr:hypothetical protein WN51_11986 [Melipona quadrifasciata]